MWGGVVEDLTAIRIYKLYQTSILVKLRGEFDIQKERALRQTLGGVSRSGLPVFVDLSGVTFLDSRCVRELAVQYQLHANHLTLCNPSWQVELSVAACGLGGWFSFCPGKDFMLRAETEEAVEGTLGEEKWCGRG